MKISYKMLKKIDKRSVGIWFDNLSFLKILFIWLVIILMFGIIYFIFPTQNSYLISSHSYSKIVNFKDCLYFSFITATTTGFGDVIPVGYFKLLTILEVVPGLLILAIVTSKLVSLKQDIILGELYDISFHEKVNRLRSTLLLFRQNIGSLIVDIEDDLLKRSKVNDLEAYIFSFEDTLREIYSLILKPNNYSFVKTIDPIDSEILINSILSSFEKLNEIIIKIDEKNKRWNKKKNSNSINNSIEIANKIMKKMQTSRNILEIALDDKVERLEKITQEISSSLSN
jgi:hypothetical protein